MEGRRLSRPGKNVCRYLHYACMYVDGVRPDKNTLGGVLHVVAQQMRDSFTLHRHLYATDVRQDWPLYSDNDRRVLTR